MRVCLPASFTFTRARPAHPPKRERMMALFHDSDSEVLTCGRRAALVADIHCFLCAEYFLLAVSIASTASTYFCRSSWLSRPVLLTSNFSNLIKKGRNMFHSSGCPHSSTPRTAPQSVPKTQWREAGFQPRRGEGGGGGVAMVCGGWRTHHHAHDEL